MVAWSAWSLVATMLATSRPETIIRFPRLYAQQRASLFHPARYVIIDASTKSGKTVGALTWLTDQASTARQGRPGRNFWWVAPIMAQAKIAYRRLKRWLLDGGANINYNDTECTITLPNGAVLWFKGSDNPDSLYGEDVYAAVVDEASRCKEEAWHAVRSTLTATRGPIRVIGNVRGRKNWAYRLGREAEAGAPDMHYAKITAVDAVEAGILDAAEVEDARARLPEPVFRELYMAEPSEEGYSPFLREWFDGLRFDASDRSYVNRCIARWISWDTALKDKDSSDYSAGVVVEMMPDYRLILREVWRQRMQFPALTATIEAMAHRYNRDFKLRGVIIEDKVSGTSAYQTLREAAPDWLSGMLVAQPVAGSKEYRAAQAGVWARKQCIMLPQPSDDVRWLVDFEQELFDFPAVQYMDQVDAFSQAVLFLEHMLAEGFRARNAARNTV